VNEKPMSFSNVSGKAEITVKKVGRFTSNLFMREAGSMVGFRGPYGKGFEYIAGKSCLVGGGCGIAPLKPLKDKLRGDAIISAKTGSELLFEDDFRLSGFRVHPATDDGSRGRKAFAHELLGELADINEYSCVYTCGPEVLMKAVADFCISKNIPCQVSAERYMKCGVGLCGSCTLNGLRVCREGPVFWAKDLKDTEFGSFDRDASGARRRCNGC
jgi:dihydroorotate dehydrogenase electron transfer subunit